MLLCSGCEKISDSVMETIDEYGQIRWFCQYCYTLVCKVLNDSGQVHMTDSLKDAVQSSVSLRLRETISQKLQSIEEKLKNLENPLSTVVSEEETIICDGSNAYIQLATEIECGVSLGTHDHNMDDHRLGGVN